MVVRCVREVAFVDTKKRVLLGCLVRYDNLMNVRNADKHQQKKCQEAVQIPMMIRRAQVWRPLPFISMSEIGTFLQLKVDYGLRTHRLTNWCCKLGYVAIVKASLANDDVRPSSKMRKQF